MSGKRRNCVRDHWKRAAPSATSSGAAVRWSVVRLLTPRFQCIVLWQIIFCTFAVLQPLIIAELVHDLREGTFSRGLAHDYGLVAALFCASAAEHKTAAQLLGLVRDHVVLPQESESSVRRVAERCGVPDDEVWRLEAAELLLADGAEAPWPGTLLALASGGGDCTLSAVGSLAALRAASSAEAYAIGKTVLFGEFKNGKTTWRKGTVKQRSTVGA